MIDTFLRFLEYEKRYSAHTITSYKNDLVQVEAYLKANFQTETWEASFTQIRSWIVELINQKHSARSINRKIASLKSYFKFLEARSIITKNPVYQLRPLKTSKDLPSFIKENELENLFSKEIFSNDFEGFRDQLILDLLYGTGIRLSELINLKETDVDLYNQQIKVLGKRNKERIIPINKKLEGQIKNYRVFKKEKQFQTNFLFTTDSGDKVYPVFIYRKVKYYLGMVTTNTKKSPHVLRHTFATHLLNKGADLNAVKDLLGHSSLAATQVYTHNSIEKLKAVFDQAHPKS
ncbi:MAG TPA: tyrosine-type recombinase/integrase [Cyclobacteriaceae bacterium]